MDYACAGRGGSHDGGHAVAVYIGVKFGEWLCFIAPDARGRRLEAGRARGVEETLEEVDGRISEHSVRVEGGGGVLLTWIYSGVHRQSRKREA